MGDSVAFAANATGAGTLTYKWVLGDGQSAMGQNIKHIYTVPGVYNGSLTVTDANAAA